MIIFPAPAPERWLDRAQMLGVKPADRGRLAHELDDPVISLALGLKIEGLHTCIVRSGSARRKGRLLLQPLEQEIVGFCAADAVVALEYIDVQLFRCAKFRVDALQAPVGFLDRCQGKDIIAGPRFEE